MSAPSYPPESMPSPIISVHDVGVQFSKNRRRKRSMRDLLFKGTMGPQAPATRPTSSGRSGTSPSTSSRASRSASSDATAPASRRCCG